MVENQYDYHKNTVNLREKNFVRESVIYTNGIKVSSILGTRTRCNIYIFCLFVYIRVRV